ncbi:hypothetical protein [Oceanobacillus halophilus]|uniref:Uncharacterized protein n=1 Tax=Oceanobacillus halophilus TaxID=930130 RepID=A0A495A4J2_9BACI|nr:hypothetical protein [Oceanobacillus halophilus]RKQ33217.1 hypothetical protein D8M06_10600 [Oceanobacillus halophilus]
MKNYVKLVDFELKRFIKIYFVLIGMTIVLQIVGVILESRQYLDKATEAMYEYSVPLMEFVGQNGKFGLHRVLETGYFMIPIGLSVAALIFYCFFIWYRDWFGKNTFVYRLLMLPTARLNVLLAKASAIFLMVLGLVGIQLILLPIESTILQWIVPLDLRIDMSVSELVGQFGYGYLGLIIPNSFIQFLINYGIGFMHVFILFTAILFERSFRLRGIVYGVIYYIAAQVLFLFPIMIEVFFETGYLYPIEIFILEIILGLLVIGLSLWISNYLLNRKVTV